MMNEPRVSPIKLIEALKAEELRRKTRSDDPSPLESALATKASPNSAGNKPCNMDGHDLNNCGHVARIIHSHKLSGQKD
jgi:hypothetical protein